MTSRILASINRFRWRFCGDGTGAVLARGGTEAFVIKVIGIGIAFGVQVLVARIVGSAQYGIYIVVVSWLGILALISTMGLDTVVLRFVAAYQARKQWASLRGVLCLANRLSLTASLLAAIVASFLVWLLCDDSTLRYAFWIGCSSLPALVLISMRRAALQALKHIIQAIFPEAIIHPLTFGILVSSAVLILPDPLTAPQVMALSFASALSILGIATWWLRQRMPGSARSVKPKFRTSEWVTVALPLFFISGMFMILNRTDIVMIGAITGTEAAGFYSVAARTAELVVFGLTAVNTIAAPIISQLYSTGQHGELQRIVSLAAKGVFLTVVPVAVIIVLFGKTIHRSNGQYCLERHTDSPFWNSWGSYRDGIYNSIVERCDVDLRTQTPWY
jgi:O-antigen/teichoic acid export membrane protein